MTHTEETRQTDAQPPRKVFLFSGHMVDAPTRTVPRFPPAAVPAAARAIERVLEAFEANADDLALAQAAAGGDLLFLEASQRRGLRCEVLLPLMEEAFIARSINPVAEPAGWRARFHRIVRGPRTTVRFMPQELGTTPPDSNIFERCNHWLLDTATAWGLQRLSLIALWDGNPEQRAGGTAQMVVAVMRHCATVTWIDTRDLHSRLNSLRRPS